MPGRPWLHDPVVSGANRAPTLAEVLDATDATTPAGTARIEGITAKQYDLNGFEVGDLAASLGLADPGANATATSSALFAAPDGKPVVLDLKFTMPSSDGTPYISDFRLTFDWAGAPISITAPADPWVAKVDGHGYEMWYPATWTADLDPSAGDFKDAFSAPDAEVIVFCRPDATLDLEDWVADGRAFYTERFGGAPDFTSHGMVGGNPARALKWEKGTVDGVPRTIINVALVRAIHWVRHPVVPRPGASRRP